MKVHYKINRLAMLLVLLFSVGVCAQAPTITSFSPSTVTQKSVVTITGTNLNTVTGVRFGGSNATSFTATATSITAIVASGTSGAISLVYSTGIAASPTATVTSANVVTYVAPVTSPASAGVTRVISNWNSYWSSSAASADVSRQPNTHHDLTAFTYRDTVISTGVDDATLNVKLGGSANYFHGDFRALPVNNISGTAGQSNYLAMGSLIDGTLATAIHTAPGIAGLKVKDVLIDGSKGLDLGTGVTNLSATAVLTFNVNSIVPTKINDGKPDILITQIASPTAVLDIYYFTDAAGNIVGNPISANLNNVPAIGTYRLDLFTLTAGSPYATVTPSAGGETNGVRDIRMIAFKLSEFGITTGNAGRVTQFRCIPGGDSDSAFTAYNASSFVIAAPVIGTQPVSQVVCNNSGNATFSVIATGTNLTYQWKKNGVDIPDATSSTYTVASTAANVAAYSVVVSNASGSVVSDIAYLNTVIAAQPAPVTTCQFAATTLSVAANGASLTYQWYSNTSSTTAGGTLINAATAANYTPPVNTVGTTYYYCIINNSGSTCATVTTTVAGVTVSAPSVAGTISANQTICSGSTANISLSGYTGNIQWQQSSNNSNWANVTGGNGNNAATYTTPALTSATYYRAIVTNGACSTVPSAVTLIGVSPVSVAGTTSADQNICTGTSATISISGYTGSIQWQRSSNNGTWTNVTGGAGANTAAYTTPLLTSTTYYRAVVTSSPCSSAIANTTVVTVTPAALAGTVSANQNICYGTTSQVSASGYTGAIQWQQSVNDNTWTDVTGGSGSTTATFTTPALTNTTCYRAVLTNGSCGSVASASVLITVNDSNIWTGAVSSAWNTNGNWSCGTIPTLNNSVIIPSAPVNQPTVSGLKGLAKSLTINSGASVTILTGGTLQVANKVDTQTDGNLVVENNAALIQDNNVENTGIAKVTKNSNALFRLDYTMWSSPVSGQNLQAFSPQTSPTRFYEYKYDYDNTLGRYTEHYYTVNATTTTFEPAKGYLIRMPNANSTPGYNTGTATSTLQGTFTGVPNNGTINRTASVAGNRYTAVGNPYPSPISLSDFYMQNSGVLDGNSALYFWRKRNNHRMSSYVTITMAAYTANSAGSGGAEQEAFFTGFSTNWLISQGQGFIVKTQQNPSVPNITFTNSMRRPAPGTGTQAFFREGQSTVSRFWLNLTGGESGFSQAAIVYLEGATNGIDFGFDGQQLSADDNISLYSVADNTNLAIQARPAFNPADVVNLGFIATNAESYTIDLDRTEGIFFTGQNIYLKDNLLESIHNITDGAYTFTSEAGTFNNRFEVIYTNSSLGIDKNVIASNEVIVYKDKNTINVSAGETLITDITIYDIRGRKLYSKPSVNEVNTTINGLQAAQEVLIIEVNTIKGKVSKRIVF
jgi:hypothetical protein